MNKKLLGISVATLFAANAAVAQTSVTLYGTVDAGIAYQNGASSAGKALTLESGQQSYSRLGFKGTEDLGGGLKAMFLLEQGIQVDTGASGNYTLGNTANDSTGTFSSQAYVGVGGQYGTLKLGRQFTPMYEAYGSIDPFMNGFAGSVTNFFTESGVQRMSNAVVYNTADNANMMGFKGALAYGFGEQAGSTAAQSEVGLSIGYANGPLTLVYAFQRSNLEPVFSDAYKSHFAGITYNFGMLTAHAAFDYTRNADISKWNDYMLGVTFPMGNHSFFADYSRKNVKDVDNADARQFAIGYTYALSKRTNVYSAYTYVRNDSGSDIGTTTAGNNVNTFQIGMRHMF